MSARDLAAAGRRDLAEDRQRVAELAVEFWWLLRSGAPARDANAATARTERLIAHWAATDQVAALLEPLLDDGSAEVRYVAAAHLHRHGPSDRARGVLRDLARGGHGPVSAMAQLLWME
jgi:hypothetical protein